MATSINDILTDPVKRESLERRFWSKVRKRGPKACWPWVAKARHQFGYGAINSGRGNLFYSHVVSYALECGEVPKGAYVLHSCDNAWCCNPSHLRLGSQADNAQDLKKSGRLKGRTGPVDTTLCARKLTAQDAKDIRESLLPKKVIAAAYGVSAHTVANIKAGRSWANV